MRITRDMWIRLIALAILLGALTTIGIAWMLAQSHEWTTIQEDTLADPPAGPAMFHVLSRRGSEMVILFPMPPLETKPQATSRFDWSSIRQQGLQSGLVTEAAHGWPLMCMAWYVTDVNFDSAEITKRLQWGLVLTAGDHAAIVTNSQPVNGRLVAQKLTMSVASIGKTILPLHPLWWRFAANTIFFAFVWAALPALVILVTWWKRQKRGSCPRCGYPVEDFTTCPECGRTVIA